MDAIEAAYLSATDRLGTMSLREFRAAVAGFEVFPVVVDGKPAGAVFVSGREIHACVQPWAHGRWFQRWALKLLADVIEKHGSAVTTATTDAGRKFVERLGFKPDGAMWIKEAKHGH